MTNIRKYMFFWISGISISFLLLSICYVQGILFTGSLTIDIIEMGIRHGTPNNQNLGVFPTSGNIQIITGQFSDYFWVEDLQGHITGYYTTIQCDGVYNTGGYRLTGVYLKAGNTSPTLIQGMMSNVFISSGVYTYTGILNPVTYIYKPTNLTGKGIVNKYGDKPYLQIIIPGGTPAGSYSGTITFSLYMY